MNDADDGLRIATAALDAWAQAFRRCDADAMAARYSTRCLHWGARAKLYVGTDGVHDYFATLGTRERRDVRFEDIRGVRLDDAVVHLTTIAQFEMDGATVPPMRLTQTLVNEGGDWKVASHHASRVPDR